MAVAAVAAGALRIGSMFAKGAGSVLSGGARGVGRSGGMLRRAVLKKSKVKRENIARSRSFNKKLMERNKRRQKEKTIETFSIKKPKLGSIPGKSFFEKILDFIGTLFLGWLFNNLPKIIKFVQDLIKRINLLIDSLKSFVENVGKWFTGLKNVVVAGYENLKNFDFTDSEGKLKSALSEMDGAFKGMQTDVEGMKNALTADMSGETSGGASEEIGPAGPAVTGTDAEKYKQFYEMAEKAGAEYPELVAAQFALESGYGTALSAQHNYFGIKAAPGESSTTSNTREVINGQSVYVDAGFKNFATPQDSVNHLVTQWHKNYKGYKGVNNASSAADAADMLRSEGYATDPIYSQKLKRIMKQNASVVKPEGGSGGRYGGGGNVVEYITGDRRHPNFEYNGHGRESNYHEHVAFKTLQDKERAKAALRAAGIQIGSEYRPGDPGWHGANLAIDVPGGQWGGSGAIGQREYNGSARVRQVLSNAGFGGAGLGSGSSAISRSPGAMPDIGASTGPQNTIIIIEEEAPPPMMMGQSGGSSPTIVMGASLNSIMKRKFLTDLAYT